MIKQHIVLCRPGFAGTLQAELLDRWAEECAGAKVVHKAAVALPERAKLPSLRMTVFARQYMPAAMHHRGDDASLVEFVVKRLEVLARRGSLGKAPKGKQLGKPGPKPATKPGDKPLWNIHSFAIDDDPATARAIKVEKALRAAIAKRLGEFVGGQTLYQIFIAGPDEAWVSVAPLAAWAGTGMSLHAGGVQRMRKVPGAPSRSSSKLSEALEFLAAQGIEPRPGETAVDLGAAPGGWTLVMALRGLEVTAVDHAELDLPGKDAKKLKVAHVKSNGLKYRPDEAVDWLCCDMVMGSRQTLGVLREWLEAGMMRRFVVNIKLPQAGEKDANSAAKDASNLWPAVREALDLFEEFKPAWIVLAARHLFHDRNEVTLMGAM